MKDCDFPVLKYEKGRTPRQWGQAHGERFRSAITELSEIRLNLLQQRAPHLKGQVLVSAAESQWNLTQTFDHGLWEELDGIRESSNSSVTDMVVLNNYTDFRDIPPDQGCSTVFVECNSEGVIGQTWDMHSSAKNYVCVLDIPESPLGPRSVCFSLVGCIGMTGMTARRSFVGINNLSTHDAKAGILWPVLVRRLLRESGMGGMRAVLTKAPVTSGHAYLLAFGSEAEIWEITPTQKSRTGFHSGGSTARLYHTNHCLDAKTRALEDLDFSSSTSVARYDLVSGKIGSVCDFASLEALLTDHDGFPKSICSHFQSGTLDPSATCGGVLMDLNSGNTKLWRGCKLHDLNFKEVTLNLF